MKKINLIVQKILIENGIDDSNPDFKELETKSIHLFIFFYKIYDLVDKKTNFREISLLFLMNEKVILKKIAEETFNDISTITRHKKKFLESLKIIISKVISEHINQKQNSQNSSFNIISYNP